MIEVVIAIGIFTIVATFMSHLLAGGMKGVLLGKRREIATHEANRLMEIARSLSYDAVGLVQTDPTIDTDTAIEVHDGQKSYRSSDDWEPIIWSTNPSGNQFNPHQATFTRGSTDLTRFVYVTGVDSDDDGEIDMKRLSVRVAWDEGGTTGPRNDVRAQTFIRNSPFAGAGGPVVSSTVANGTTMSVKSARGDLASLTDAVLPSTPVTVTLPTTTGGSKYRAVSDVNCTAKSATLAGVATYGGHSVTVTADDDPTTATPSQPAPQSWSGSPPDAINGGDDVDDVVLDAAVASPVSCTASADDDDDLAPTDDGLPYEKGSASSLGTLNLVEDLTGTGLVAELLNIVTAESAPFSQEIDHQTVGDDREVYATAGGALGTLNVLKVTDLFPDGLVKVDGLDYAASVRAAEGTPSAAPSVDSPTITFSVYDVANEIPGCTSRSGGYCNMTVDPAAAGFTGLSIDFEHSVLANLGLTEVAYQVRVDVLPPAMDPLAGVTGPNGERRWSAEYTPMAVSARLKSTVTVDPLLDIKVLLTDSQVDLNLGSVKAEACSGVTCL